MADVNPVAEALDLLSQQRASLAGELRKVDEAIAALEKLVGKKPVTKANRSGPSVRTKLVSLLEEEPRDWSAGEIIHEYERRGDPIQGADPSNALRAAFADAKKRGMIVSTGVGRYQASKWSKRTDPATPQGAGPDPQDPPPTVPQPEKDTIVPTQERRQWEVVPQ
jgi:hypothetical protein